MVSNSTCTIRVNPRAIYFFSSLFDLFLLTDYSAYIFMQFYDCMVVREAGNCLFIFEKILFS